LGFTVLSAILYLKWLNCYDKLSPQYIVYK
jgi:hypothetical protein